MNRKAGKKVAWEDAPLELTRRNVFQLIYGDTGTGKTSLALTAPGPIALLHASEKIEGVVQRFASSKKIMLYDFGNMFTGSRKNVQKEAEKAWLEFKDAWLDAYSWARTIIIDTETDAWELIRLSYFGDIKPDGGRLELNWGPPNGEWNTLIKKRFRSQDSTNLILISRTKDEFKSTARNKMGARTGRTIRAGQRDVQTWADVAIRTDRNINENTFTSRIEKGWWNAITEGGEFLDEDSTFPNIMSFITETEPEAWE